MGSPERGFKQKRGGKSHFLALNVNIAKTVGDSPMLLLMTNRKPHVRFWLTSRSMTLDDPDLLYDRIHSEFRGISQIWEPTTTKRMKIVIDPYCQRQNI